MYTRNGAQRHYSTALPRQTQVFLQKFYSPHFQYQLKARAWTIAKGSTAPVAGMAIHTDFKDKFIRAEVIFWKDLLAENGYANARLKGLVRTEGKEYIVKDGDVMEFKV
jgi:ribosome-binding ATPase YchF (GTP1/OBG family)